MAKLTLTILAGILISINANAQPGGLIKKARDKATGRRQEKSAPAETPLPEKEHTKQWKHY